MAQYVVELRRLAVHCKFGSYLEEALCDCFVCGLCSEAVQKKLLMKEDFTFQEAIHIVQASEQAFAKARQLQSLSTSHPPASEVPLAVGKLSNQPSGGGVTHCYQCGKADHALKGHKAKISVDPGAQPRFCKAHPVPYAVRMIVDAELDRLQQEGIIELVQFANSAAPVVPVVKQDKTSLCRCVNFNLTVNRASKLDRYPIPKIEDLFAKLVRRSFSKLDMSQAYQQIVLDEESRDMS